MAHPLVVNWSVYRDPTICRDGFVLLGDVPKVSPATLKRAVRRDGLIRALPGAYVLPERKDDLAVWLRVVCQVHPTAIISGRAAWELGTQTTPALAWPARDRTVVVVDRINHPDGDPFRFRKRDLPERYVMNHRGVRAVMPVYAAAELLAQDDGAAACEFLRRTRGRVGGDALAGLGEAVSAMARVPEHRERKRMLAELVAAPWSVLELRLHRLLRAAGLTGWVTNHRLLFGLGWVYVDVAFPDFRVAIEADGREHHSQAADFESDRARWNLLAADGWIVLRVSWAMVQEGNGVIAQLRAALARRS